MIIVRLRGRKILHIPIKCDIFCTWVVRSIFKDARVFWVDDDDVCQILAHIAHQSWPEFAYDRQPKQSLTDISDTVTHSKNHSTLQTSGRFLHAGDIHTPEPSIAASITTSTNVVSAVVRHNHNLVLCVLCAQKLKPLYRK